MKSRTNALSHRPHRNRKRVTPSSSAIALAAVVIGTTSGAAAQPVSEKLSEVEMLVQHNVSNRPRACEELSSVAMRDTTITSATTISGGTFTPPGSTALTGLPDFCRVVGTVYPTINFEVWLPVSKSWNGKLAASGSGGTGGYINYGQLASIQDGMSFNLKRGYVAAATDQGHTTASFTWLLDPGRLVDWGSRGNHEVAVRAKALTRAFYGVGPKYSYFEGCSGGGQQALMQAQRFPEDYDGIVAGAPANNWSALMTGELWNGQATLSTPATVIPAAKLPAINNAVLAVCDGDDGLKDGVVGNPPACKFDPSVLLCAGADNNTCLTAPQVDALKKIYAGPRNPRTNQLIYPGLSVGGELNWGPQVAGPLPSGSTVNWYRFGVFEDPNWDWKVFDYDKDWEKARAKLSYINDSIDPDLRRFRDMGRKLIVWHGWGDYLIASQNSIDYYDSVVDVIAMESGNGRSDGLKKTQDFARLFMVPGLGHCAGGNATETFDPLAALEQWVERNKAPDAITASHVVGGATVKARPLCPHPQIATYKGRGDPAEVSSFDCTVPNQ